MIFTTLPDWRQIIGLGDVEDIWEMIFSFMYVPHGGSGIPALTEAVLMEYDVERIQWLADRVDAQRALEAAAMRRK